MTSRSTASLILFVLAVPLGAALALDRAANSPGGAPPRFTDARKQAAEFIGYTHSLKLTPAQQTLRDEVLTKIDAPCCRKYTTAKCCCECNLSKTIQGLASYMIVKKRATAPEVRTAALSWIHFVNPNGFSRDICDQPGACERPFSHDGCGGMSENALVAP